MKEKKKYIKVCPHCGGIDITIPPAGMDIKMTMPDYCPECRNRGVFPEVEADRLEDFRKQVKDKNKNLNENSDESPNESEHENQNENENG